jgi:drug/metabolite transporter (DMT)-like permease
MTHVWVVITLLGWGIAGVFDKKAVENGNSRAPFLAFHLFNIPLVFVLLLALPVIFGTVQLNAGLVLWEGLDAFCAMLAMVVYYQALIRTQASWVLGITAGYPVIGQVLAFSVLGEQFSWMALASAATVSLGVACIGYSGSQEQKEMSGRDKLILWASVGLCTLLWGVLGILDRQGLAYGPPMDGFLTVSLWKALFATALIPLMLRGQTAIDLRNLKMWRWSWLAAASVAAGNVGFLFALPLLPTGYVIVVTACYPLIMYICALLFLGERINPMRAIGIVIIVAGLVLAELGRPGSLAL